MATPADATRVTAPSAAAPFGGPAANRASSASAAEATATRAAVRAEAGAAAAAKASSASASASARRDRHSSSKAAVVDRTSPKKAATAGWRAAARASAPASRVRSRRSRRARRARALKGRERRKRKRVRWRRIPPGRRAHRQGERRGAGGWPSAGRGVGGARRRQEEGSGFLSERAGGGFSLSLRLRSLSHLSPSSSHRLAMGWSAWAWAAAVRASMDWRRG